MENTEKQNESERHYPPFWEKVIPVALGVIVVIIVIIVLIIIAIALDLFQDLCYAIAFGNKMINQP
ncbi:MAG: hypothetical protein WBB69_06235 [Anaerolineales bacterium]